MSQTIYTPVHTGKLYEKIVEQIESLITSGMLHPGDKLPSEKELADQFGVSRTAVREAMKALTYKGLIDVNPGRGTFVSDNTTQAVRHSLGLLLKVGLEESSHDLIEVREILEPEIASLAASNRKGENIASMQKAVAIMDASHANVAAFIEADLDFHLALAEATQNLLIPILIDTLVVLLRESRERMARVPGGIERAQEHHHRILNAIIAGDARLAYEAMRDHLKQVREDSQASIQIEGDPA